MIHGSLVDIDAVSKASDVTSATHNMTHLPAFSPSPMSTTVRWQVPQINNSVFILGVFWGGGWKLRCGILQLLGQVWAKILWRLLQYSDQCFARRRIRSLCYRNITDCIVFIL